MITQTGAENIAHVEQFIRQRDTNDSDEEDDWDDDAGDTSTTPPVGTLTQFGSQSATVNQGPATGDTSARNTLRLIQTVRQMAKSGATKQQDAYQSAVITQTALGGSRNQSDVDQVQRQKAYGGTSQSQNTGGGTPLADCDPVGVPTVPNACVNLVQHSQAGRNRSELRQVIREKERSRSVATQVQGSSAGGIEGRVHQDTVSGTSIDIAKQLKQQRAAAAAGSSQTQIDPISCCGFFSQDGGAGNTETIQQSSTQHANGPTPVQQSSVIGESKSPTGRCTISQDVKNDGASTSPSESQSPCVFLSLVTSCSNVESEGGCGTEEITEPPTEPPLSTLDKDVRNHSNEEETTFSPATTANPADTVEYRIIYSNTGSGDAHTVTVNDVVPEGLTFIGCSPEPCSYNTDSNTITWDLGTVEADSSEELRFLADVVAEDGVITNTATASTKEEAEPVSSNPATVTVVGEPPQSLLEKAVRNVTDEGSFGPTAFASPGETLEYRIVYLNDCCGGTAHSVTVTDPTPSGTTFVSCTMSCTVDIENGTITWNLGDVETDTSVEMLFRVTVDEPCCRSIENTASVDTKEEEPKSSNAALVSVGD
jgi:uncharacterized repeat protein (TIGR01451 family)